MYTVPFLPSYPSVYPYVHPYPVYVYPPVHDHGRPPYGLVPYRENIKLNDYGPEPFVISISEAAKQNDAYRIALWTGPHLQVTLMSLHVGEDIGLEIHPHVDQFLRIEQGEGIIRMGKRKEELTFEKNVRAGSAIMVPAGTWHNVINTGTIPLKLYSIYAPPQHPRGTVHRTKADALAAE
ncbi:cupin domain-containing protein [Anoxybacillus geothermalis]|uniref:cupin domain-containing protein n=1 Tax=Geobacillus sp. WSUCF-018B TaxID=2055939 RepID=UPI0005082039|nr:cupin domain-containing protein [Geobacillus sp. WSUCF-018B]KFL16732.1 cupin [Geobacillus stearothermophilus]MED0654708.1 cupin domain-containing protein [Anoxybacillus geothermalis]KFX32451.1 cupin [Geobacillus stearothermophilus]KZM53696.1 cupin [Geobacillus stearothermophilus]MED4876393.1 cupin domain-containing protein [Anoxybacillus geothermalis]